MALFGIKEDLLRYNLDIHTCMYKLAMYPLMINIITFRTTTEDTNADSE